MVDARFYVVSLVAVFLALGLGILVGSVLLGPDLPVEQRRLVERLEREFERIRGDNRRLQEELRVLEETDAVSRRFAALVAPKLLAGQLAGQRAVIVQTGDRHLEGLLADTLRLAGADVGGVVSVLPAWRVSAGSVVSEPLLRLGRGLGLAAENGEGILRGAAAALGTALATPEGGGLLGSLVEAGLVEASADVSLPADLVVIVGRGTEAVPGQPGYLDIPLVSAFLSLGRRVVAVEGSDTVPSGLGEYARLGVPTVDNVDTVPGQVALVYLLRTGAAGRFGVKDAAEDLLPVTED